jgi:tRNA (guanosine-2'-O-)-methyltransferase
MRSEKRIAKIEKALGFRQPDLRIVLENIHDPHNVSAIFRTCDSIGVPEIFLVYNRETFPKIGKKISASAYKWVKKTNFTTIDECYTKLRSDGFKIYATEITENSKSLWDLSYVDKIAIVLGNEHRGVSKEASEKADSNILIPMFGMVQSLNVSVSTAIILYEIARQRFFSGGYDKLKYHPQEFETLLNKWLLK